MPARDSCLIVAAHPDDETVGCGIWMQRRGPRRLILLHITDGSPLDGVDARKAGFPSREAYAAARREELHAALDLLGVKREQCVCLPFPDQGAYLRLPELVAQIRLLVEAIRPGVVLAPAYEGGHPDHDSAALAVYLVRRQARCGFRHREYRLYHSEPEGGMNTLEFLPCNCATEILHPSLAERELKARMLSCFRTQRRILSQFDSVDERFRDAPAYNFRQPPHPGPLLYERWGFVDGADWRQRASECL
jgi:LmbE family N-acetylglucosaminyl deacetylase